MKPLSMRILPLFFALAGVLHAAEYFVSTQGSDDNDGASMQTAFATIQTGVDALAPGDTLTILPGEYFGTVRRDDLGSPDVDTVIRADIPGTAILRGDRPAPPFRKVEGYRYVYVADFDTEAHVVNELDTLRVLEAAPSINELEFTPGRFHQDLESGKLYLSSTDLESARNHRYTISVSGTHGIYMRNPQRLTIEGLAVTGFNRYGLLPWQESITDGATWGIFLRDGSHCVIRDCRAYFNGRGIVVNSNAENSGDNVIERCVAWANASRFGGSYGGISLHMPRRDTVRDCVVFLNGHKGINIRSEAGGYLPRDDEGNYIFNYESQSHIVGNLAWGNPGSDFKIKTGHAYIHTVEYCVGPGIWTVSPDNVSHSVVGRPARDHPPDTINLANHGDLDPDAEFADPANFDYRLQATSRFRGAGPDGVDAGPFPYQPNIYYLSADGDDSADGLSVGAAWRSLERAARALEAGDTLYFEPGEYSGRLRLAGGSNDAGQAIAIRGRGRGRVVLREPVEVQHGRRIEFERLHFSSGAVLRDSEDIQFKNTRFTGNGVSIHASDVNGLRVTHSEFTGFDAAAIELSGGRDAFLSGNHFDNAQGPAVRADTPGAIRYSDYNAYRNGAAVWTVNGTTRSVAQLAPRFESHSTAGTARNVGGDNPSLQAGSPDLAVAGPYGAPAGPYLPHARYAADELAIDGPALHSATGTTANIEWWSSRPEVFEVRWGKTPDLENRQTLSPINPYHPHGTHVDHFSTFSLTGLEPGTRYYFRLVHDAAGDEPLTFTTPAFAPRPRDLYVAPDGDDANSGLTRGDAWRTVGHAADQARPGDTVRIAGGTYREMVRVRATGREGAPITFTSLPGEKVIFDGNDRMLPSAFNIFNKSHIAVDGFYFQNHGRIWTRGLINIQRGRDIRVTRCFADGRSRGTSPELVTGGGVTNLLIQNCVQNIGWGGIALGGVDGLRFENNVLIQSDITPIGFAGARNVVIDSNIVTDNLAKKRFAGLAPRGDQIALENNCFYLRWPEDERSVFGEGRGLLEEYNRAMGVERPNLAADPRFAALAGGEGDTEFFTYDTVRGINDFPDAFATNPLLVERGIGLQPEAFADFHFNAPAE